MSGLPDSGWNEVAFARSVWGRLTSVRSASRSRSFMDRGDAGLRRCLRWTREWLWDLADRGIYAIDRNARPVATICFYDFATQRVRSLGSPHRVPGFSVHLEALSVSPDGRWLVYSGGIFTSDIMMMDNFR